MLDQMVCYFCNELVVARVVQEGAVAPLFRRDAGEWFARRRVAYECRNQETIVVCPVRCSKPKLHRRVSLGGLHYRWMASRYWFSLAVTSAKRSQPVARCSRSA